LGYCSLRKNEPWLCCEDNWRVWLYPQIRPMRSATPTSIAIFWNSSYAVPRDQLVRPGQRRSLMRRALNGIVPDQLLNRKRKAFVVRSPLATIRWESLTQRLSLKQYKELVTATKRI